MLDIAFNQHWNSVIEWDISYDQIIGYIYSVCHVKTQTHAHTRARSARYVDCSLYFKNRVLAPPPLSLSTDICCLSLSFPNSSYPDQTQRFVGSDFDTTMTDRVQETEVGLCIKGLQHAPHAQIQKVFSEGVRCFSWLWERGYNYHNNWGIIGQPAKHH